MLGRFVRRLLNWLLGNIGGIPRLVFPFLFRSLHFFFFPVGGSSANDDHSSPHTSSTQSANSSRKKAPSRSAPSSRALLYRSTSSTSHTSTPPSARRSAATEARHSVASARTVPICMLSLQDGRAVRRKVGARGMCIGRISVNESVD